MCQIDVLGRSVRVVSIASRDGPSSCPPQAHKEMTIVKAYQNAYLQYDGEKRAASPGGCH